jgi:hypothetical protein
MATPVSIPRQYENGFAKIHRLSDEAVRELASALEEAPLTVNDSTLAKAVASQTNAVTPSDVAEIIPALVSLASLREVSGASVSDVAEGVAVAMEAATVEEFRLPQEDHASFRDRLTTLLGVDSLMVVARAGNILLEQEHYMRQARILTDIRPVFEREDPEASPKGAVIVHTLKIGYFADNEYREFFVALDASHVSELANQLERANSKAESLRSVLERARVPYVDAE